MRHRLARRERGQALVLGLFVLFIGTLSLFYLFSTGQVSAEKQRVTNTADAAAYSAALWRARVMNYHAYSNRAMIANEVAVAQTLTLFSHLRYAENFAKCMGGLPGTGPYRCTAVLGTISSLIPGLNSALSGIATAAGALGTATLLAARADTLARSRVLNQLMEAQQELLHASTNFLAVQETVVRGVSTLNDARYRTLVLPDTFAVAGGNSFTARYSHVQHRRRVGNLARESVDPFTRDRRFDFFVPSLWPTVEPPCSLITPAYLAYRKRGGTELAGTLDRWEAVDTLSEWWNRWNYAKFRCDRTEVPMGWGSARTTTVVNPAAGGAGDNSNALRLARGVATVRVINTAGLGGAYAGVQDFRDLNYAMLRGADAAVAAPTYTVHVVTETRQQDLRTANNLNVGTGRLRLVENTADGELVGVGAAEVYFQRPSPRADGRVELPSLFNPYWQARLVEVAPAQRAAALLL